MIHYRTKDPNYTDCSSDGFRHPKWCQTECWQGSEWKVPGAVAAPSCDEFNRKEVLLYTYSATYNFEERMEARKSYRYHFGNDNHLDAEVGHVFVIGYAPSHLKNTKDELILQQEITYYQDILYLDFTDGYHQLGYKGLGVFRWAKNCGKKLKFLMKNDDDIEDWFVQAPVLIDLAKNMNLTFQNNIFCMKMMYDINVHEKKEKSSWEVSFYDYPGYFFPMYCKGDHGTIIPAKVASTLLQASKFTKIFRIDDVYISGLLRHRACIGIKDMNTFSFMVNYMKYRTINIFL